MSIYSRVLLDESRGIHESPLDISPQIVGGTATGYRVRLEPLQGGLSDGVHLIHVDNGVFSFSLIPTRGMGVWKARSGTLDLGWRSPVRGPVHPRHVPVNNPNGWGWLEGFDELLVRCGLESSGDPDFDPTTGRLRYPLHGRIANLPALRVSVSVDDTNGDITITGIVEENRNDSIKLRLTSSLTTRASQPGFSIRDEVENLSADPVNYQLLYHVNFGAPLLGAGTRFCSAAKVVVPRDSAAAENVGTWDCCRAPLPPSTSEVYLLSLASDRNGRTRVLLRHPQGQYGASLAFNVRQLPCFTLWKKTAPLTDGYVTALEPGTNFPNPRTFEARHGRVATLTGGGRTVFDLEFSVHGSPADVGAIESEIRGINDAQAADIIRRPQSAWCPSTSQEG